MDLEFGIFLIMVYGFQEVEINYIFIIKFKMNFFLKFEMNKIFIEF